MNLVLHLINGDTVKLKMKEFAEDEFKSSEGNGTEGYFRYNVLDKIAKKDSLVEINRKCFEVDNNTFIYTGNILWFEVEDDYVPAGLVDRYNEQNK